MPSSCRARSPHPRCKPHAGAAGSSPCSGSSSTNFTASRPILIPATGNQRWTSKSPRHFRRRSPRLARRTPRFCSPRFNSTRIRRTVFSSSTHRLPAWSISTRSSSPSTAFSPPTLGLRFSGRWMRNTIPPSKSPCANTPDALLIAQMPTRRSSVLPMRAPISSCFPERLSLPRSGSCDR